MARIVSDGVRKPAMSGRKSQKADGRFARIGYFVSTRGRDATTSRWIVSIQKSVLMKPFPHESHSASTLSALS